MSLFISWRYVTYAMFWVLAIHSHRWLFSLVLKGFWVDPDHCHEPFNNSGFKSQIPRGTEEFPEVKLTGNAFPHYGACRLSACEELNIVQCPEVGVQRVCMGNGSNKTCRHNNWSSEGVRRVNCHIVGR